MVQRKAYDKLGIQAETKNYVKSEKQSTVTKLSTSQNQETRNKGGPELKKLMKKSRSIKRSEFDCLRSNPMKRGGVKSRPDKPSAPPPTQKPLQVKIPETPPNYMKSTSSSIARKERLQVSPHRSSITSCDSKSPGRKDSNYPKLYPVIVSGHKPGRALTKTTSLRPVRTLTKTSSNKAGRTSMKKKSSGVALYTDQKVRRATCSSTLKDSKFPTYVSLHPGGTESEGISVMKVCPYTYCSLNGHHHAQLPPLKCFLSARRRLLKTQKSMRLKNLSSGCRKPSARQMEDIDTGQKVFNDDPAKEESVGSAISPLINDEGLDFFLEIYAQPREDDGNDQMKKGVSDDPWGFEYTSDSAKDDAETETLPDESSHSVISFEDNISHDVDFTMEMDTPIFFPEYTQKEEVKDGNHSPYYAHKGGGLGDFSTGNESGGSQTDYSIFDASGMDWEEGEVEDVDVDNEVDRSTVTSDEHDTELNGELTFKPDDIVSNCYKEAPASEYTEENFNGVDQTADTELSNKINSEESIASGSRALQDPPLSNEDVPEKSIATSEEKDELSAIVVSSDAAEYPSKEPIQTPFEDEKTACSTQVEHKNELEEQGDNYSEPEMHQSAVPEDLHASAGVDEDLLMQEPENMECELKSQLSVSADSKADQAVSKTNNFDQNTELLDAKVNDSKKFQDIEDPLEDKEQTIYGSTVSAAHSHSEEIDLKPVEEGSIGGAEIEEEDGTGAEKATTTINAGCISNQQLGTNCSNYKPIRRERSAEDFEKPREFNPRGPRFLPLEPEQDPEKVDLRHQMMDDRKNSEEWMLDFALRRAVSKLAPARKRKVALLVEAFETVIPLPKYEIHMPHTPTGFAHTRFLQACS